MLESYVNYIQEETERLQAMIAYIYGEVWKDKLANRIDNSQFRTLISEAEGFCSEISVAVEMLGMQEERLRCLADKY